MGLGCAISINNKTINFSFGKNDFEKNTKTTAYRDEKEVCALRSNAEVNKYLEDNEANQLKMQEILFIGLQKEPNTMNELVYWAVTLKNIDKSIGTICYFNFSMEHHGQK